MWVNRSLILITCARNPSTCVGVILSCIPWSYWRRGLGNKNKRVSLSFFLEKENISSDYTTIQVTFPAPHSETYRAWRSIFTPSPLEIPLLNTSAQFQSPQCKPMEDGTAVYAAKNQHGAVLQSGSGTPNPLWFRGAEEERDHIPDSPHGLPNFPAPDDIPYQATKESRKKGSMSSETAQPESMNNRSYHPLGQCWKNTSVIPS